MVLLSDPMEYQNWQRVANAVKKKWHNTHRLDTSDSTVWHLYRKPMLVEEGTLSNEPEISFDKDEITVYLCADHIRLESSVEKIFGKVLKRSPVFKESEDRREYLFIPIDFL
jgi:hypothetical protein